MESVLYLSLSSVAAIAAVVSVYVAKAALSRGLTYYEMNATIYALAIMAVARIWHTIRELIEMDDWAEMFEYALYIAAYVVFIFLARRVFTTKKPKE